MLNLRSLNEGIDNRKSLFENYHNLKYSNFQLKSLDDYERLVEINLARDKSKSEFVRKQLKNHAWEHSNDESAYMYFTDKMKENGLYLSDEPKERE